MACNPPPPPPRGKRKRAQRVREWDSQLVTDWLAAACPNLERLCLEVGVDGLAPPPGWTSRWPTEWVPRINTATLATPLLPLLTSLALLGKECHSCQPNVLADVLRRLPKLDNLALGSEFFGGDDLERGVAVVAQQLTRLTLEYNCDTGNVAEAIQALHDEPICGSEDEDELNRRLAEEAERVEEETKGDYEVRSLAAYSAAGVGAAQLDHSRQGVGGGVCGSWWSSVPLPHTHRGGVLGAG